MSPVNFTFTFFRPHPQGHCWSFSTSHNQLPSLKTSSTLLSLTSIFHLAISLACKPFLLAHWHLHSSTLSSCKPVLPSIIPTFIGTAACWWPHTTPWARETWLLTLPKRQGPVTHTGQLSYHSDPNPRSSVGPSIIYHLWPAGAHEGIGPTRR